MTFQQIRQNTDRLRNIPLEAVLLASEAQLDRYDRRKWHTKQGVLSITGPKFMNWNRASGGGGAIDLVIHLHNLGFKEALQWLQRHFPDPIPSNSAQSPSQPNLRLPTPAPSKLTQLRDYLVTQRGLASNIIDRLIEAGSLYADSRANAVFLLLGKQNIPVGAELRGTTSHPWRGMAPGSQKDLGFFSTPNAQRHNVILCESAIDAISCFMLCPHYRCISTAGARPNPRWLPSLIQSTQQVYCGYDNDPTGHNVAQALIALHPSVQRLCPSLHDWNDLINSPL